MGTNRRKFLQAAGAAGVLASCYPGKARGLLAPRSDKREARIDVLLDEKIAPIHPNIYGHFSEHIGGVIYDGIWVGRDSKVPHYNGIRKELVDWMRRINPPVIRWPGGCFADRYHWRDGIGADRPKTAQFWADDEAERWGKQWGLTVREPNSFGTHEFIEFSRLVGAEPYLAANVGSGSPREFQQWGLYCNAPKGLIRLADERATNGSPDPFRVRYWGVGNESWGCGGDYLPEDYADEFRRYLSGTTLYGVPVEWIASGSSGLRNIESWTRGFFSQLLRQWDLSRHPEFTGFGSHYYCGTAGDALRYDQDQWYQLLFQADRMEEVIERHWPILGEFDKKHQVKLMIDEWGAWHPPGTEAKQGYLFGQQSTLRDALVAALTLDVFNRHADKVTMGCIAQLVNNLQSLFLAAEDQFVATPTFYVFAMYKQHQGADSVRAIFQAPRVGFQGKGEGGAKGHEQELWGLNGSASLKGKRLTLTVVNPHVSRALETRVALRGSEVEEGQAEVITHQDIHAHNTFANKDELTSRPAAVRAQGTSFAHTFPAASVTRFLLKLS